MTDTANIQGAINSLAAAGGGTLYLAAAVYYVPSGLTPANGVVLQGAPPVTTNTTSSPDANWKITGGTRLQGAATLGAVTSANVLFAWNQNALPGTDSWITDFWIKNVGFQNYYAVMRGGAQDHMSFFGGGLENVWIERCQQQPIQLYNFQHWTIRNLYLNFCFNGIEGINYHSQVSGGNSQWYGIYAEPAYNGLVVDGYTFATKSSWGIRLGALTSQGAASHLNQVALYSPQVNNFLGTAVTGGANLIFQGDGTSHVVNCAAYNFDCEGVNNWGVLLDDAVQSSIEFSALALTATQHLRMTNTSVNCRTACVSPISTYVDGTCAPWFHSGPLGAPNASTTLSPIGAFYRTDLGKALLNLVGNKAYDIGFETANNKYGFQNLRSIMPPVGVGNASFSVLGNSPFGGMTQFSSNGAQTATFFYSAANQPGMEFEFVIGSGITGTKTITDGGSYTDTIVGGTNKYLKVKSDGNQYFTVTKV